MSKAGSGLFSGTKGSSSDKLISKPSSGQIKAASHDHIKSWAMKKRDELAGKAKKNFNSACVAYDDETGKYYYGRNGGFREKGYQKNPLLFGDSTHEGLLPKTSLNKYPVGNCAEVDAINRALMLMYGKEASNRKQEIDRQHYTIPNQRPKDKHCGKI